ncbi:MAG: CPBP family intramembrane glutamic endopeptidase [Phycisphaerales bacterium]|jgi:membrane protease YdiL (CAAX protease family)|nr:CPBP family intramembrane glutamic endopeptidase [Phycisphaerales bacterium]
MPAEDPQTPEPILPTERPAGAANVSPHPPTRDPALEVARDRSLTPQQRRSAWMQIGAVTALGVMPHIVVNILPFIQSRSGSGQATPPTFVADAVYLIATCAQIALPTLLIMHLVGGVRRFGLVRFRPVRDTLIGAALYAISWLGYMVLGSTLHVVAEAANSVLLIEGEDVAPMGSPAPVLGVLSFATILAMSLANGFTEEVVLRGFLLRRLAHVGINPFAAIMLTTLAFSAYHAYQGGYGILSALIGGITLGAYVVGTGRLWPCIVAHILSDVIPMTMWLAGQEPS